MADYVRERCSGSASTTGLLVTDIFEDVLTPLKTVDNDELVQAYLKSCAFEPAFEWNQVFDVTVDHLVPWHVLKAWIPQRVEYLLTCLRAGEQVA
jgi:hypothetical protein